MVRAPLVDELLLLVALLCAADRRGEMKGSHQRGRGARAGPPHISALSDDAHLEGVLEWTDEHAAWPPHPI
jgi:hypothetical protein